MIFDSQSIPAAGGMVMAAALYAGAAYFIAGPVVGERLIEKSGWSDRCPRVIAQAAQRSAPTAPAMPKLDCSMIFGWFGPEGRAFCETNGAWFSDNPLSTVIEGLEEQARQEVQRHLRDATSGAASRCDCAASLALESSRTDFALHAGSLRLLTPHDVKTLDSALERALTAPLCAAKG